MAFLSVPPIAHTYRWLLPPYIFFSKPKRASSTLNKANQTNSTTFDGPARQAIGTHNDQTVCDPVGVFTFR